MTVHPIGPFLFAAPNLLAVALDALAVVGLTLPVVVGTDA